MSHFFTFVNDSLLFSKENDKKITLTKNRSILWSKREKVKNEKNVNRISVKFISKRILGNSNLSKTKTKNLLLWVGKISIIYYMSIKSKIMKPLCEGCVIICGYLWGARYNICYPVWGWPGGGWSPPVGHRLGVQIRASL